MVQMQAEHNQFLSLILGVFWDSATPHLAISMKSTEALPLQRTERWNQAAIKEFTTYLKAV